MKKKRITTVILVFIFLAGLCLLLYPKFSNYWNSIHQSREVDEYVVRVENMDGETSEKLLQSAREYNRSLLSRVNRYKLTSAQAERYPEMLNVSGTGVMGYIRIPVIDVTLPVYHGISRSVLQTAVGHLDWTSLPVGGESSHCALSAHRGLPSSKLFSDLDKVEVGDIFMINVLRETLTYEVDQILIVEPEDTLALQIEEGKDLCTLVACTPYGVNTHRLLVRGHRVENSEEVSVRVGADALIIEKTDTAPFFALPVILVWLIVMLLRTNAREKRAAARKKLGLK